MLRYSSSPEQERVIQMLVELIKIHIVPKLVKKSVPHLKPLSMEQIENIIDQLLMGMEKELSMPKIPDQAKEMLMHSITIAIYPFYIKQLKYNI